MGLDELLNNDTDDEGPEDVTTDIEIKTEEDDEEWSPPDGSTEPSIKTIPSSKTCPNCGAEGKRFDDLWRCEEKWCGVDHFVTEKGHFCLPLSEDDGFLSDYSV